MIGLLIAYYIINNRMKITDIDKEIRKEFDRQKEYGDYQYNFTILAELFTLILAPNLKKKLKPYQVAQIMMTLKLFRSTRDLKLITTQTYLSIMIWH